MTVPREHGHKYNQRFKERAEDGRWFSFDHQQFGKSCAAASVKIAKELAWNTIIGEECTRAMLTLFENKCDHTGLTMDQANADLSLHDWSRRGMTMDCVAAALRSNPYPLKGVEIIGTDFEQVLRNSSVYKPSIIFVWFWYNGSGHAVVCAGPLKTNPNKIIILDPARGLKYICLDTDTSVEEGKKYIFFNPDNRKSHIIDSVKTDGKY